MDKNTNKVLNKAASIVASAALSLAVTSSNATCFFTAYQPVEPKGLNKFSKK